VSLLQSTPSSDQLAEARFRLAEVRERIAGAAVRAGRDPALVTLVGVAKRQPVERVRATIAAGLRVIGQSYVQETRAMRPAVESALAAEAALEGVRLEWRLVGRLQRNKAALAARLFDAVESVDRVELADALAHRARMEGRPLEVLLQVSLCDEPQKGGCPPEQVSALAQHIRTCDGLRLNGLMTVPRASDDPEKARPVFRRLRELRDELARHDADWARAELSMGMSNDLEVAVEEGATLVRVGTALFGDRIDPATLPER
jgi:pyridoxal phosphate enzyme (YggS family)